MSEQIEVLSLYRGLIKVPGRNGSTCTQLRSDIAAKAAQQAASEFGCAPADIFGACRFRQIARARQYAMWLLREQGFSFPEIGRRFDRDHSTVIHAVRAHAERIGEGA